MAMGLVELEFGWHHSIARPREPRAGRKNLLDISYTSRVTVFLLLIRTVKNKYICQ